MATLSFAVDHSSRATPLKTVSSLTTRSKHLKLTSSRLQFPELLRETQNSSPSSRMLVTQCVSCGQTMGGDGLKILVQSVRRIGSLKVASGGDQISASSDGSRVTCQCCML